ncbi:beta-1,3-galactosyltransferase 5 isoform X2 [Anoplophora glabripennis]|nr:beta-1,3-galactosyltransferase 5 isoform X2 [Anoplophora glabripennis]XP_018573140.1 beta-1,3-galactosyltransferase 5 isoform X2 [Anoplophora glabripennis]XP_018573141.1 beta-1,3-galactosyltransferase 5 isoform X2 [Anoplophora glabripennis]
MGGPWLAQVRCLHLAIFALAMIPLFLCLSYLNTNQLHTTASPLRNYNVRVLQANTSQEEKNNPAADPHPSRTYESSPQPAPSHQTNSTNNTNQGPDLTRGIAAEIIYEAGHVDVNSQICPDLGKNIKLLIAITSAPSHEGARLAVRETWGHFAIRKDIAIAFMLGATSNQTLNSRIDKEQELYGDIIRGKFIDTYDNLTLKTISMLEWVDNYCPKASFVLKTDDDMFINVSRLLAFIAKHKPEQRAIYGRLAKKWKPIRNKKSKYYISPQQYKPSVFPDFTTGPAYLLPAQISKELYVSALNHTYFKLEDVFVTGIVANGLKIKRVHAPEFLNKRISFTPCNIQKEISIHMVKSTEQYDLWKKLHDVAKCKK